MNEVEKLSFVVRKTLVYGAYGVVGLAVWNNIDYVLMPVFAAGYSLGLWH